MSFERAIGVWETPEHQPAVRHLKKAVLEDRLAHAYLLVGPRHVGKLTLALDLARAVNCLAPLEERPCGRCSQCQRIASGKHADIRVLSVRRRAEDGPARKERGIDEVREVEREASLMPFEGRYRVFIFDGAERMSEEASNALLKTLEEPPPQVLLVLIAEREGALLATVRSRCQRMEMRPLPYQEVLEHLVTHRGMETKEAEGLARLSQGCLGWAVQAAEDPQLVERRGEELDILSRLTEPNLYDRFRYAESLARRFSNDRDAGREVLYLWLQWWRDILIVKRGVEGSVLNLERIEMLRQEAAHYSSGAVVAFMGELLATLDALEQNAAPRLALDNLMLALPKREV